jgi:hypothetical protein
VTRTNVCGMKRPNVVVLPIRPAEPEALQKPVEISFWMGSRRHLILLPPPPVLSKKAKIIRMPKRAHDNEESAIVSIRSAKPLRVR